jgi:uncharacterized membrane protein YebE (DUF533 family)
MIRVALAHRLAAPQPANTAEARAWLTSMIETAMADGFLTSKEYTLISSTAARVGMSEDDLRMLVSETRRDLFTQARDALRNARR